MFNPNSVEYSKKIPTDALVFEEVTDYEVFRYYIGEFTVGKPFSSPFREDKRPSFAIFPSKKDKGRLFFKDHRGESGDSLKFVRVFFNCGYKDALERIITDFDLTKQFTLSNNFKQLKPVEYRVNKDSRKEFEHSKLDLKITSRQWMEYDLMYWKQYGISLKTLKLFNVVPIKYYWMYGKLFKADKYAYAYKEFKDCQLNYKVYQPFSTERKFLNGFLDGTWSGWHLIPEFTNLIILTKATKEAMFFYERNYVAIAPQGEGYTYKPHIIKLLKSKCNKLIQFYDHDIAGITAANRNRNDFGIELITTLDLNNKDITDFYKTYKEDKTQELLNILL